MKRDSNNEKSFPRPPRLAQSPPSEEDHRGEPGNALNLTMNDCIDPDLAWVSINTTLTLCNGESARGQLDLSGLTPEKILAGTTIAGVAGEIDHSNLAPQNVVSGVTIAGVTGTVIPTPGPCTSDGATDCVTTVSYRAADMTRVVAGNIRSSITVAGVAGSYTGPDPLCSSDGETSCIANPSFKAAEMSNVLAGNIKNGVTIAGVTGLYPSATYTLPTASATTDLTSR